MENEEINEEGENSLSKNHKCDECSKTFAQQGSLSIHKRIHSGERPFPCSVCTRKFSNAGNLKVHVRIHTGEKPYQCVFCQKSFSQQNTLKSHVRIHTGEKPYDCTICIRSFRVLANLRKHESTHTKENAAISCAFCSYKFRSRKDHDRHSALFHKSTIDNLNTAPPSSTPQENNREKDATENLGSKSTTSSAPSAARKSENTNGQKCTANNLAMSIASSLASNINETNDFEMSVPKNSFAKQKLYVPNEQMFGSKSKNFQNNFMIQNPQNLCSIQNTDYSFGINNLITRKESFGIESGSSHILGDISSRGTKHSNVFNLNMQ